jgi:hypothetical protein
MNEYLPSPAERVGNRVLTYEAGGERRAVDGWPR